MTVDYVVVIRVLSKAALFATWLNIWLTLAVHPRSWIDLIIGIPFISAMGYQATMIVIRRAIELLRLWRFVR